MPKVNNKISLLALGICYIVMIYTAFNFYPRWKQHGSEAALSWDVSGYYMYLPAIFIYKDIKQCSFKDSILAKYYPTPDFQQAFKHEKSGNYVMKYSSGQAITMLPFFAIAHLSVSSLSTNYAADGFSYPYQFCIGVGMLFYALLGLFILRLILVKFFKDTTVAVLLFSYVIGSNYLNYTTIDQGMSHNVLFTIYCCIIYFTILFHDKPTWRNALAIGCFAGLATLTRPTEIISLLLPLCWNISTIKHLKAKWQFLLQHFNKYALMGLLVVLFFFIQMAYWKYAANEWLVYSYEKQGFKWLHPHLNDFALSYKCGWLRYCPIMILPIIGIVLYAKQGKNALAIILFAVVNYYLVTAWSVWSYNGTAGRAMVQCYPILAFPFCLLIERLLKSKILSIVMFAVLGLFAYINIWWTYNAHSDNIQVMELTAAYYWKVLGTWKGNDEDRKLLDNPHSYYGVPKNANILLVNNFDDDTSANAIIIDSESKIKLSKDLQSTTKYSVANNFNNKKWIRATAEFQCTSKEWDVWSQAQFVLTFMYNGTEVQKNSIKVHRFLSDGETKEIYIDAIVPKQKWDVLTINFINTGGAKELYIDNLNVVSFDE
jgi:hypothetical protein